jgi:nitrogen-specific signal transduction histidine kinase
MYCIGQMEDITLRRAMEEERAEGARLAGIVETTIAVAHEMNNALTVLMLNAELLDKDVNPAELAEISREILAASASIAGIVQRLRQIGDLTTVDYLGEARMLDLSSRAKLPEEQ